MWQQHRSHDTPGRLENLDEFDARHSRLSQPGRIPRIRGLGHRDQSIGCDRIFDDALRHQSPEFDSCPSSQDEKKEFLPYRALFLRDGNPDHRRALIGLYQADQEPLCLYFASRRRLHKRAETLPSRFLGDDLRSSRFLHSIRGAQLQTGRQAHPPDTHRSQRSISTVGDL